MKDLHAKLHTLIGKYGLRGLIAKVSATLWAELRAGLALPVLLYPARVRQELRQSLAGDYERVILWRSGFGYHVPLYQRPQQMARALARQGCLVLYEAKATADHVDSIMPMEKNLLLVNLRSPLLRRMLLQELDRVGKAKYLQLYSTDRDCSLHELQSFVRRGWRILFEYVDALSPEISGTSRLPKPVADKFLFAMTHPEVTVVTTAERLRRDVLRRRGAANLICAGNGVDYAFFQQWEDYDFEPAFRAILARGKPIVCYYGALASWIDYELLRMIAAAGKYILVLIGVRYDASYEQNMRGIEGVDELGPRDYRVLKYYAKAADVLILPFLINEVTRATSPVKLFEYMALHKPIVSTDVDECRRCKSVLIAKSRADFLRQLDHALALRSDEAYLALLDAEARANDWSEKARAVVQGLKKQEKLPGD